VDTLLYEKEVPDSNIHTLSDLLNSRNVRELQSIASNQYHSSSPRLFWKQDVIVHAHDELGCQQQSN